MNANEQSAFDKNAQRPGRWSRRVRGGLWTVFILALVGLAFWANVGGVADYVEQHTGLNLRGHGYGIATFDQSQNTQP